eukprot:TRINITY_DN105497_c0_g1_i1.p1 TRINITY_DN105497_c0_g1~~TRINITY_DN105497_c0_g1_i1.p1  ORF type:complete len:219 (+),score=49.45 TRINITY_DN105497_c0_g1_i1:164-820(+)
MADFRDAYTESVISKLRRSCRCSNCGRSLRPIAGVPSRPQSVPAGGRLEARHGEHGAKTQRVKVDPLGTTSTESTRDTFTASTSILHGQGGSQALLPEADRCSQCERLSHEVAVLKAENEVMKSGGKKALSALDDMLEKTQAHVTKEREARAAAERACEDAEARAAREAEEKAHWRAKAEKLERTVEALVLQYGTLWATADLEIQEMSAHLLRDRAGT